MWRLLHRMQWWLHSWLVPAGLTALPPITKLSPRVVRVLADNPGPMTLQGTNTYLVGTGRHRLLIDTGSGGSAEYVRRLQSVLHETQSELQSVILTHWHADHVGGVADLRQAFGALHVRKWPCPEHTLNGVCDGAPLSDDEQLCVEGATLRVLHTPGHTSDHVAMLLVEEHAVFSGDCVLGEGTAVFSDLPDYMRSLHALRQLDARVIYPGHGTIVTQPRAKLDEYIEHRMSRERQIIEALESAAAATAVQSSIGGGGGGGMTADQLVLRLYSDKPFWLRRAARINVVQHLGKLLDDGRVSLDTNTNVYTLTQTL